MIPSRDPLHGPGAPVPMRSSLLSRITRFALWPVSKLLAITTYMCTPVLAITERIVVGESFVFNILARFVGHRLGRFGIWKNQKEKVEVKQIVQSQPSITAKMVCVYRMMFNAIGACDDYLAQYIVHSIAWKPLLWALPIRFKIEGEWAIPFMYLAYRTEFFDRIVRNSDAKQVVILAAGYDTRAYRGIVKPGTEQDPVRFFEVDIAPTQSNKRKIIASYPNKFTMKPGTRIEYVPVDFSKEKFMDRLVECGFDSGKHHPRTTTTVVLIEGLVYYLTWPQIEDMLLQISRGTPAGTLVGLDLFQDCWSTPELLANASKQRKRFVRMLNSIGEPLKWGLGSHETVQSVFEKCGFVVRAEFGQVAMAEKFGKGRCTWAEGRAPASGDDENMRRFVLLEVV